VKFESKKTLSTAKISNTLLNPFTLGDSLRGSYDVPISKGYNLRTEPI